MHSFNGKTALVTGGARGVGRAVSMRLARSGAHVVVNCFHSYDSAQSLQSELAAEGLGIDVVRGSVARRDQVERMFAEVQARVGGLDYLVNNAASGAFGGVDTVDDGAIERALGTNLKGAWWCARQARELMAGRRGAIVNVSSVGSTLTPGNYAAVGTSKAALESLTRYLAAELAADGIRVNTASASLLEGDVAKLFPSSQEMANAVRRATPFGRLGEEGELADVVLFLLSDMARWVTGQIVVADGGLSLGASMLTPAPEWADRQRRALAAAAPTQAPAQAPAPAPAPAAVAETEATDDPDAIAIVGAGIVVPGATNLDDYWDVLREGPQLFLASLPERWRVEAFTSPDRGAEDKSYQSRSAYITDPVPNPTGEDDGTSAEVEYTARWLRHAVADALRDVHVGASDRLGCVFGYTPDGNQHLEEVLVVEGLLGDLSALLREDGLSQTEVAGILQQTRATLEERYPRTRVERRSLWPRVVGARAVAGLLPSEPEMIMVDTACSSSLYALDIGVKALQEGRQDVVLCGGTFAVGPRNSVLFAKLNGLSESGAVRPLDRDSDGVLFSDGAAVVVAKRLADARRDGDQVLGYVLATGSSSDGKGKAIYAPSVAGQKRAVQRAWAKVPGAASGLSWVVAHATGTPAGDLCELTALGEEIGPGRGVCITSNKSVIGHTGWAAGVASVIQVLLAFRHGTILPQHRFDALPARLPVGAATLTVPTQPVAWPAAQAPRVAAVSGFGFGGTNAHVLLSDKLDATVTPESTAPADVDAAAADDDMAIVAWAAHFPGLSDQEAVSAWLDGGDGPAPSYGPTFADAPARLRIPPPTQRVLDRCQLLALACAEQVRAAMGQAWDESRNGMGVFIGHMGPTRSAVSYAKRCFLDDVLATWSQDGPVPDRADITGRLRERVRAEVPTSTEDSFPGMMPNVIAARISNYFDLHGPNLVVDTGFGSALSAFEVARRYLAAGDVEVALVGGLNGNSTPEIGAVLRGSIGANRDIREGAVLFAVTTVARARALGLPVLARVSDTRTSPTEGTDPTAAPRTTYLGADGALQVLQALHDLQAAPEDTRRVQVDGGPIEPASVVLVTGPEAAPARPVTARAVRRHVTSWHPAQAVPTGTSVPVLPADAVVVTATPTALGDLGERAEDPLVLSVSPCTPALRRRHVTDLSAAGVATLLAEAAPTARHVRVLSDLETSGPAATALVDDWSGFRNLHDLAFLVLQAMHGRLEPPGGSLLGLFLRGDSGADLHPFAGLFSGLVKTVALELPACLTVAVFTTADRFEQGIAELQVEAGSRQDLPVVAYRDGVRHGLVIEDVPAQQLVDPVLGVDDVVVAVGGGHGITAELLRDVVADARPTIYVIGSTPLDELWPQVEALGGPGALDDRAAFLRARLAAEPGRSVQSVTAELDRLRGAALVRANLEALEQRCGSGRVHYRRADVLDRARVADVVDEVFARHGRVDLVIHAAGINRSGALATKPLEAYRQVRAVKVGGYCNLRAAFAGRAPRLWCSFGSFIGLTGQLGEADYASANDFLTTAAAAMRREGREEFTVGWTLWEEVGMGAHPVTRAFLAKSGVFTRMSTAEGVAHFADEMQAGNRAAAMFHLGDAERRAIEAKLPGFLDRTPTAKAGTHLPSQRRQAPPAAGFYLDRVVERDDEHLVAERLFDERRDSYLADHTVAGVGTLPGLFVPEIAAEAALALVPDLLVVGFRDLAFERFLKLVPALTATPRRIEARVTARGPGGATVRVEICGDVTAAGGRVLQRGVRHFVATVVLADAYPSPVHWAGLGAGGEVPVLDPYHLPGASVLLRGPFVTTRDTRMHPLGKRARYVAPVARDHEVFSRFVVPSLLLDGLARVAVLDLVAGRYVPVAAPRSIRRIDIYENGSDAVLGDRYPGLELTVTPGDLDLEDPTGANRFVAFTADGRIVAQMHDVRGVVLGYVDASTGTPVNRAVVDRSVVAAERSEARRPVTVL